MTSTTRPETRQETDMPETPEERTERIRVAFAALTPAALPTPVRHMRRRAQQAFDAALPRHTAV